MILGLGSLESLLIMSVRSSKDFDLDVLDLDLFPQISALFCQWHQLVKDLELVSASLC